MWRPHYYGRVSYVIAQWVCFLIWARIEVRTQHSQQEAVIDCNLNPDSHGWEPIELSPYPTTQVCRPCLIMASWEKWERHIAWSLPDNSGCMTLINNWIMVNITSVYVKNCSLFYYASTAEWMLLIGSISILNYWWMEVNVEISWTGLRGPDCRSDYWFWDERDIITKQINASLFVFKSQKAPPT